MHLGFIVAAINTTRGTKRAPLTGNEAMVSETEDFCRIRCALRVIFRFENFRQVSPFAKTAQLPVACTTQGTDHYPS